MQKKNKTTSEWIVEWSFSEEEYTFKKILSQVKKWDKESIHTHRKEIHSILMGKISSLEELRKYATIFEDSMFIVAPLQNLSNQVTDFEGANNLREFAGQNGLIAIQNRLLQKMVMFADTEAQREFVETQMDEMIEKNPSFELYLNGKISHMGVKEKASVA